MRPEEIQQIVEAALMASTKPLSIKQLLALFTPEEPLGFELSVPDHASIQLALNTIDESCQNRGFELKQVSSGWRFQVKEELSPWVTRLWQEKPQKYSRALLETLAIIAYRQPITRGDVEEIRGVAVSSYIIKTLSEREWIKVIGQRDVPGRPSLYATTKQFLDYFNLKHLDELPSLQELTNFDSLQLEPEQLEPEIMKECPLESTAPPSQSQAEIDGDNDLAKEIAGEVIIENAE